METLGVLQFIGENPQLGVDVVLLAVLASLVKSIREDNKRHHTSVQGYYDRREKAEIAHRTKQEEHFREMERMTFNRNDELRNMRREVNVLLKSDG